MPGIWSKHDSLSVRPSIESCQPGGKRASACLMLFLWLGLMALVSSPLLHAQLHSDSQRADHVCLVTQLQHQQMLLDTPPQLAPSCPEQQSEQIQVWDSQFVSNPSYRLAPGRGPPAADTIG